MSETPSAAAPGPPAAAPAPAAAPMPMPEGEKAVPPKMSGAELKKQKAAEKAARRAAAVEQKGGPSTSTGDMPAAGPSSAQKGQANRDKGAQKDKKAEEGRAPQPARNEHPLPVRARRASQSANTAAAPKLASTPKPAVKKEENKQVELFSHLYTQPRRHTIDGTSKDVHPAVLALGFQLSSYEICGSSARCVAMLQAFSEAIQSYSTPAGTSLARHMNPYFLSPQIDFLKSCRPISESMGNAIRYLKKLIVEIDPSTGEQEAKDYLCESIDKFIQERITVANQAIAGTASGIIVDGSVVLTYAKSAIVEKTILQAHARGTRFRVLVADSRPLFEGKNLATSLMKAGVQVEYVPFSGVTHAVQEATLVFLGAHSMLSNGRLMSRIGTAAVAMAANKADVPVIVCCESVKFSGKVALDSIVLNEVAPSEELLLGERKKEAQPASDEPTSGKASKKTEEEAEPNVKTLHDWKDIPNLQILNLMYDVTPAEFIHIVICEYGSVPPSSVPHVHRLANEGM